jgi:hypothetical protein
MEVIMNNKRYQIKCSKCGNVREILTTGSITEQEKVCSQCGTIILEQNIAEIKQEFLLEDWDKR